MNLIFTTDIKSNEATNCSFWWKIEGRFDSGCEEEDDEEDDDFVLQFSSDESDGETSSSSNSDYSSTSSNNQITASTSFDKNCNDNLSMEKNIESTTNLLNFDNKIASIRDKIRRKYTRKILTSKNQKSVLDYFSRGETCDENIFTVYKDRNLNKVVDMEKLIDQLLTARVILERIPNLTLTKNPALNNDQFQAALLRKTQKYCPTCNRHVQTRKNTCYNCSSFLAFECPKCGLRYKTRKYLARHKKLNCLDNPEVHRCTECKFSSLFKHNLLRHVRNAHTNYDDRKRGRSMKNGRKRRMSSGDFTGADSKSTSKK